jgi:hypothetical protein
MHTSPSDQATFRCRVCGLDHPMQQQKMHDDRVMCARCWTIRFHRLERKDVDTVIFDIARQVQKGLIQDADVYGMELAALTALAHKQAQAAKPAKKAPTTAGMFGDMDLGEGGGGNLITPRTSAGAAGVAADGARRGSKGGKRK